MLLVRRFLILLLGALLIAAPFTAFAQTVTVWNNFEERPDAKSSPLTLAIGSESKFGFQKAWSTTGVGPRALEPLTADIVVFQQDSVFGEIWIHDGRGEAHFEETTASSRVGSFGLWKGKTIEPSANGSFLFYGVVLKWISFSHTAQNGVPFSCAGYVASGRGSRFDLSGYWCTGRATPMNEAGVLGFVNAIGYKDLFKPRPLAAPPGR